MNPSALIRRPGVPAYREAANDATLTMTSREIAELTSKRHSDVLRDARVMLGQLELDERNFASVYVGGNGEERPQLALTKDLTITLVAGYSATLRHRIVSRWLELEAEASRPALPDFSDPAAAARAWADQFEQRQRLAVQVERQQAALTAAAPKVEFFDRVVERDNLITATQVGQKLKLSAVALNKVLDTMGVYNKSVQRGRAFQQWFVNKGYGLMKQTEAGYPQPLFTPAGGAWVVEKMIGEGY